mmetsp:Transcript_7904/g.19609  ORF Transcript_7904/g.19609 Transcript_7904/m.19609 type:complete len:283 (+) Transcript_7904:383-1231(+)
MGVPKVVLVDCFPSLAIGGLPLALKLELLPSRSPPFCLPPLASPAAPPPGALSLPFPFFFSPANDSAPPRAPPPPLAPDFLVALVYISIFSFPLPLAALDGDGLAPGIRAEEQRSIYSNMSSSRPRKCPQHMTKSTCRRPAPPPSRSPPAPCASTRALPPLELPASPFAACFVGPPSPPPSSSSLAPSRPSPLPPSLSSPPTLPPSKPASPSSTSTTDEDPHSPIIVTMRSTAAPLLTPIGRTSTDFEPWMTSTAALEMGPVHRCCSRSRACCLPKSGSAYL